MLSQRNLSTSVLHRILLAMLLWGLALSTAPAAEGDYRLGPGDLLKISVFDHPELATEARVSHSGNITFPLVGQIAVTGLSTADVERSLAQSLATGGFIRQAQVSVLVMEYESQKVAVMGQVLKPGQYPLAGANHVLGVLALAGGLDGRTAADHATLLKRDGSKFVIDLAALLDGDMSQNAEIAGGDTLNIPRAPQFYIYGEVQKPGMYRLERNMTVSRAISAGGGLTPRGSERRTVVKRRDEKGIEREYSAKSSDILAADDVVFVRESWF